nr:hypothetical protein [Sulfurimonas lithotrophica]
MDPLGLYQDPRLNGKGVPAAMGGDGKGSAPGYGFGPFGGICGEQGSKSATWIPDISPDACKAHDECYSDCSKSQRECDLNLFMSNPYYGMAVMFGGKQAYDNAQGK